MIPDAKWLEAVKLPIKAKVAIALACGILLILFKTKVLTFSAIDPYIASGLIIAVVVFGVLVVVDVVACIAKPLKAKQSFSIISARRAARKLELRAEIDARQAAVLKRLEHLSRDEICDIAEALNNNSQTLYTYVHSPSIAALQGKGLIWTTGGTHHQDYYPFTFYDFVWEELLERRDEFLSKERKYNSDDVEKDFLRR